MASREIEIVQEWHTALNTDNKEKLSALVKKEVQILGPRGNVKGVNMLLEWVDRARITLTPKRYFKKATIIVVEEWGEWHNPETGKVMGEQTVTTVFTVEDYLISSIARYGSIKEAFEASGLNEENEVKA